MRNTILALAAAALASCAARPVSGLMTIPKDTPASCTGICDNLGLKLGAVVVIASEVGCVCENAENHATGAAAAAAGVYVALWRANDKREEAWVPGF